MLSITRACLVQSHSATPPKSPHASCRVADLPEFEEDKSGKAVKIDGEQTFDRTLLANRRRRGYNAVQRQETLISLTLKKNI
jgi:hypothetical protein